MMEFSEVTQARIPFILWPVDWRSQWRCAHQALPALKLEEMLQSLVFAERETILSETFD